MYLPPKTMQIQFPAALELDPTESPTLLGHQGAIGHELSLLRSATGTHGWRRSGALEQKPCASRTLNPKPEP